MDPLTSQAMKSNPFHILRRFLLAGLLLTGWLPAQQIEPAEAGAQIGWATNAFATNFRADGVTTFASGGQPVYFELGAFGPAFNPAVQDFNLWKDAWTPLASAIYNTDDDQVIATSTLTNNNGPFQTGAQAWIWAYTSKELAASTEWLIVAAPSWIWPDKSAPLPVTFSMGDARPSDALIGSVNPSSGAFHMRLEVIPEPGSAALALTALALAMRRRRR